MNLDLTLGDVTSVNVNVLRGGVQCNVVPSEMSLEVDIRIAQTDSHEVCTRNLSQGLTNGKDGTHHTCTVALWPGFSGFSMLHAKNEGA